MDHASGLFQTNTLLLLVLLLLAKGLGLLCSKIKIPELVGEIIAGVLLGNLGLLGLEWSFSERLIGSEFMQYSSQLSIVLLLFIVGLESNFKEFKKVWHVASAVALVGVVVPVALGVWTSSMLNLTVGVSSWFVGAALAATSVGITARIMSDQKVLSTPSAQIILGAAVVDDVIGILILVVLAGVVTSGTVSAATVSWTFLKALAFFVVSFFAGRLIFPKLIYLTSLKESKGLWLVVALVIALGFSQLAVVSGLAAIIGAFVAGLILDDVHFVEGHKLQKHTFEELLKPIVDLLLPIFFVMIGAQVKLLSLGVHEFLTIGILVLVATVGKIASGLVAKYPGVDRWGVGIGMIPRGEVGLIFVSFAAQHGIFDPKVYSMMVVVVLITTVLGPLLLQPRLNFFK